MLSWVLALFSASESSRTNIRQPKTVKNWDTRASRWTTFRPWFRYGRSMICTSRKQKIVRSDPPSCTWFSTPFSDTGSHKIIHFEGSAIWCTGDPFGACKCTSKYPHTCGGSPLYSTLSTTCTCVVKVHHFHADSAKIFAALILSSRTSSHQLTVNNSFLAISTNSHLQACTVSGEQNKMARDD